MKPISLAAPARVSLLVALVSVALSTSARAADDGRWEGFYAPSPRYGHTMVYDSHHDRMVLFGGGYFGATYQSATARSDVFVLEGDGSAGWRRLETFGSPPARHGHTAIYDPLRRRMLVFGGRDAAVYADVWELDLDGPSVWTPLAVPDGPTRWGHTAIYDAIGDRMIVYAGRDGANALSTQVWSLELSGTPQWVQLATSGGPPPARTEHVAVYDPARRRMVVQGGVWENGRLWFLDLATRVWTYLDKAPPPSQAAHGAILDAARDRMVVSNGELNPYDVWWFDLGSEAWQSAASQNGELRYQLTLTRDPARDRMIAFGGYYADIRDWVIYARSTQALDLDGATAWQTVGPSPPPADPASMVLDPPNDRLVLTTTTGIGTLTLGDAPTWTPLGIALPVSQGHASIRDAANARLVAFGGTHNQVWSLSLNASPQWTQLFPTGTAPTTRGWHSAIYDAPRGRMIVFGGDVGGTLTNQVWSLTLGASPAWTQLAPSGTPPSARSHHGAIYDPAGDRMIVFGGHTASGQANDVWALSLSGTPQWTALAPAGTPPPPRRAAVVVHDDARHRLLVFAGGNWSLRDVWALSLSGAPVWTPLAPAGDLPAARTYAKGVYDAEGDRMIVYGGTLYSETYYGNIETLTDFQQLRFTQPVLAIPQPPVPSGRIELLRPAPNPASTAVDLRFRASVATAARVAIYDLSGRRIRTLFDGRVEAGEHRLRWDLADAAGNRLAAGVYLCAVEAGGSRSSRRMVVLP